MPAALTLFGVSVVICALAHFGIVRSVIRARSVPVDPGVQRPNLLLEIVWALIPAIALALVLIASWPDVRAKTLRDAAATTRIAR